MNAFNARPFQSKPLPIPFKHEAAPKSSLFQRLLESVLNTLSPHEQPRIRCYTTRQGQPAWSVYDPLNRTTHQFVSEEEVRIWLEQRYYQ
ncbi:MAG: hypothetical protein ICV77_04805 [Cyanobacteria bacterium Co-bin8]|nr:hypothetical protein [Cyanobacteria bacterium Co-bin8]